MPPRDQMLLTSSLEGAQSRSRSCKTRSMACSRLSVLVRNSRRNRLPYSCPAQPPLHPQRTQGQPLQVTKPRHNLFTYLSPMHPVKVERRVLFLTLLNQSQFRSSEIRTHFWEFFEIALQFRFHLSSSLLTSSPKTCTESNQWYTWLSCLLPLI